MPAPTADIGLIGLAVMGQNLVMNMNDHGYTVVAYNRTVAKVDEFLAREAKVDYRRVEAASVKMPACFTSAEGKRLFVRMFATLQLNAHFISVIARTRLDAEDIARVESALRERIDAVSMALDKAIDGAEVGSHRRQLSAHS